MKISVVYALSDRQIVRELELPEGATVAAALHRSGLLQEFPLIDPTVTPVGIYGKVVSSDVVLQPGDRVEIYRPLNAEPRTARRFRSKKR
jgi:putative ubiquitin-RnfH superfamily antitoxin RatB of RatAB toxin-antitoxin module